MPGKSVRSSKVGEGAVNSAWGRPGFSRSLNRDFLNLMVDLRSAVVLQTRRGGPR